MIRDAHFPAEKIEAVHALIAASALGAAFQPIVDLRTRKIHAYEALARCSSERFRGPAELFAAATEAGRVGELGRLHRELASRDCAGSTAKLSIVPRLRTCCAGMVSTGPGRVTKASKKAMPLELAAAFTLPRQAMGSPK